MELEDKAIVRTAFQETEEEMLKKVSRGIYPGPVPFGYSSNKTTGAIEIDIRESRIVSRIFELGSCGAQSAEVISHVIMAEVGVRVNATNVSEILGDLFYVGIFSWRGRNYFGTHPIFLLFHQAQSLFKRLKQVGRLSQPE